MVDVGGKIAMGVGFIIIAVAMLATIGVVVDQVDTVLAEAVNWTFTGHEGAEAVLGLAPFGWIAGIAVFIIVGAFSLAKGLSSGKN